MNQRRPKWLVSREGNERRIVHKRGREQARPAAIFAIPQSQIAYLKSKIDNVRDGWQKQA